MGDSLSYLDNLLPELHVVCVLPIPLGVMHGCEKPRLHEVLANPQPPSCY